MMLFFYLRGVSPLLGRVKDWPSQLNWGFNWARLDYSFGKSQSTSSSTLFLGHTFFKIFNWQPNRSLTLQYGKITGDSEIYICPQKFSGYLLNSHPTKLQNLTNTLREKHAVCLKSLQLSFVTRLPQKCQDLCWFLCLLYHPLVKVKPEFQPLTEAKMSKGNQVKRPVDLQYQLTICVLVFRKIKSVFVFQVLEDWRPLPFRSISIVL